MERKYNNTGLTEKELENEFDGFYVYIHIYKGEVIYCGKGVRRRCLSWNRRDYYHLKDEIEVEVVARFDNEKEALKYEKQLISEYKAKGQCRYNKDKFVEGKRVGKKMNNTVATEEVEEFSIQERYNLSNVHNISIPPFELQMIRNKELRSNTVEFMNSLESYTQEELEDVIGGYEQWVNTEEDSDLQMAYRFVLRYMRRYYEKN